MELSIGWISLAIVGSFFIAIYIIAPLKIRTQQVRKLETEFVSIEMSTMPSEVSQIFLRASEALMGCGFQQLGLVREREGSPGIDGFVSLWVHHASMDSAQVIAVRTWVRGTVTSLVTFCTEFLDETSIVTSNSTAVSCFPPNPRAQSIRCPGVQNFQRLYSFHRRRVARDRGPRLATLDRVRDTASRLQLEHRETFARLIESGYYSIDEVIQRYVPTLRGAYLMTYRLLPPFKQVQMLRRDRLAGRTLRDLGFEGLAAFRRS